MKFCNRSISCTQAEKRASIALSMHNNNNNGENWTNNLILSGQFAPEAAATKERE